MPRDRESRSESVHSPHKGILSVLLLTVGVALMGCSGDVNINGPSFSPTAPPNAIIGSGSMVTETMAVQSIDGVSLEGTGRVQIDHGAVEALMITGDDNLMQYLTIGYAGGRLILGTESGVTLAPSREFRFELTVRELRELFLPGVGDMEAFGIDAANLRIDISGVGSIQTAGQARRQVIQLSGVGDYLGDALASRITVVDLSGVGGAVVRASERIEGFVGSQCTLEYYGDPQLAITGGGSVRRLGP